MIRNAQETLITLEARGTDAREVFTELFTQAKVNFVLQVDIQRPVYLTLRETPFSRALQLLCEATGTRYSLRDGVYYIAPIANAPPKPPVQVQETRPRTVRLLGTGIPLRTAAAEIEKQAGVKIEVAPDAPNLRYTLNLSGVSVEQALSALCEGVGLRWEKTEAGYRIAPVSPPQARPTPSPTTQTPLNPRAASARPRPAPPRPVSPEPALRCPKCRYTLQIDWRYCPLCGAYVKHITDKAKREQEQRSE
ncbi:MAG: zinc ribbon domain-containing protein [Fimbriimonadales bacterium]|nr:zinc ribbon domain-containing protein [Fimbriimonadales bacterium]